MESGRKADRVGLAAALATYRAKRATLLIAKLDRLARSVAFIFNLMEDGVDFVAANMPSVNQLTVHVLAAVAEHEREMISQRTKAALAAAKVRGTKLGNPRLPATNTLAPVRAPATPGGRTRAAAAQARAVAAYGPAIEKARAEGALSLGDYAQALQAARLPAPQGGDRWSRPSVARVLRYCKEVTATVDQASAAKWSGPNLGDVRPCLSRFKARSAEVQKMRHRQQGYAATLNFTMGDRMITRSAQRHA